MPQANLQSVQTVVFTMPVGEEDDFVTINHGLVDQEGNPLTPDKVHTEVVNTTGADLLMSGGVLFYIVRSSPEDGTLQLVWSTAINASPGPWTATCRVVCEYTHSIQSRDRTP
jgi:hypothetical protein